jgi:pantoate--beta-alanine ligase
MQRLIKQSTLDKALAKHRRAGRTIGFTPTLGALHSGHLQLMQRSQRECDVAICSIFVNPTQFNDPTDLKKYPRTLKADKTLLESIEVDYLFNPLVDEVYPKGLDTHVEIDFGQLDKVMEGAMRPGHFAGVAQVVKRLLDMVRPTHLYMGQKDFQQFTIIQHMIDLLDMPVQLVVCPIVREADGLAMSSRNRRLSDSTLQDFGICTEAIYHHADC